MENLHVKIENAGNELVIREGDALPLLQPVRIELKGNILSVAEFLTKRAAASEGLQTVNAATTVVIVNREEGILFLNLDPNNPLGTTVLGKLEQATELNKWHINEEKTFTREQLIKLFKFAQLEFRDTSKYQEIMKAYQSLNISASSKLQQESDTRGNKNQLFQKQIDSSTIPTEFVLSVPVFKGFPPVDFRVEICLEATDQSVRFWFESVELDSFIKTQRDLIFDKQLESCKDFVIIEK